MSSLSDDRLEDAQHGLFAVVSDGPESYQTIQLTHPWQAFAIAKWKSLASGWKSAWGSEVAFVGRGRAWHPTTLEEITWSLSVGSAYLLHPSTPPDDQWFWRPDLLEARGFSKWVDFTIELSPWNYRNSLHFNVDIELTPSGAAKALQYAKGVIEEECRKVGKPVPWDGL